MSTREERGRCDPKQEAADVRPPRDAAHQRTRGVTRDPRIKLEPEPDQQIENRGNLEEADQDKGMTGMIGR